MKKLIKNGNIINVFTEEIQCTNVLIDGNMIVGVGDYDDQDADIVIDAEGKYIAPGFIDGHIHIESTMLSPKELSKICILHGTTSIIADPHEIANVCGKDGIEYMINESNNIPLNVYITLPSCVPATSFDESGKTLNASDLEELYKNPQVIGLGEMMNYPGVIHHDEEVIKKVKYANDKGYIVNGHAPLLSGRELDKYISVGIRDDHECSNMDEAKERIQKGQMVMIREGSFAKNLNDLVDLFDEPYAHRCMLVTDDRHPIDLIDDGHIDNIIRKAVKKYKKSIIKGIKMATIQTATYFNLKNKGAIAPGYDADIIIFEDMDEIIITDVVVGGNVVVQDKKVLINNCNKENHLNDRIINSVNIKELKKEDFFVTKGTKKCRVISIIPEQLITKEEIKEINFDINNGIDVDEDILKIAVIERHHETNHIGLGFIKGIKIKKGAIASTIAHDSHNLTIVGTNDEDMAVAGNYLKEIGGGYVIVSDGKVLGSLSLEIAGLMSTKGIDDVVEEYETLLTALNQIGINEKYNPFTSIAFVCLPVILNLKITTKGLVDVNKQEIVSLFVE